MLCINTVFIIHAVTWIEIYVHNYLSRKLVFTVIQLMLILRCYACFLNACRLDNSNDIWTIVKPNTNTIFLWRVYFPQFFLFIKFSFWTLPIYSYQKSENQIIQIKQSSQTHLFIYKLLLLLRRNCDDIRNGKLCCWVLTRVKRWWKMDFSWHLQGIQYNNKSITFNETWNLICIIISYLVMPYA